MYRFLTTAYPPTLMLVEGAWTGIPNHPYPLFDASHSRAGLRAAVELEPCKLARPAVSMTNRQMEQTNMEQSLES
ncbi:hypothetical protein NBRC116594_35210 [Shimia sp. NS0008-38b]|uniref:hypothetical protein n=1 Tax=Shimia sp. NS0008-38b TaxID=3127653 RepID=UPI0031055DE3